MRFIILAIAIGMALWSSAALAVDEEKVRQAVEEAKKEFEKAIAEQGGWMSTKQLISSAELSATKGNKQKALELAEQARREAELSYQEAVNQEQNWSEPGYLK